MKKLVIGIDAVNLRRGGGRTHLIELLNAADPVRDEFSEIHVWGSMETLQNLPHHSWLKKEWSLAFEGNLIRRSLWQKFSLGKAAQKLNCDILFIPGGSFSTHFRPVVSMNQNILPFDGREIWRYGFSLLALKLILLRFTQTMSFRKAEGVIFLTEYARQRVCAATGQLSGESRVIPHGLNSRFLVSDRDVRERNTPQKSYPIRLLYVSIVDEYKHQWHVVEAVSIARKMSQLDLQLDLIGPSYKPALKRLYTTISEHDPHGEWAHYHGAVDYQKLHSFYRSADIGIWASSCETFGLILLEMMGAGLPILSSDRGPMPEIFGDAGKYFDPEKPESLSVALLELLASEDKMVASMIAANQKARTFSWERCAADTFEFLRNIALNTQ